MSVVSYCKCQHWFCVEDLTSVISPLCVHRGKTFMSARSEHIERLLLGLSAKIKRSGVLPAHLPLGLDAGILVPAPQLSCAGFVCCHCTGRWAVLDNTHGNDSTSFR